MQTFHNVFHSLNQVMFQANCCVILGDEARRQNELHIVFMRLSVQQTGIPFTFEVKLSESSTGETRQGAHEDEAPVKLN